MARSLGSMYGSDDTGMAESIASSALDTSGTGTANPNQSDYWDGTKDERAMAKGNAPEYEDYEVKILRKTGAGGGDSEGLDASVKGGSRHRQGPKTSEDIGGGITDPPPSRATSKTASRYPKYSRG